MWPLTSYEVLVTELEKLERLLSYDIFPSPKILASVLEEIHLLALLVTINTEADIGQLHCTQDWKLLEDLGQKLYFPLEIVYTDIMLWWASLQFVLHH